ncbi:hypothetical protein GY45DRAFT_930718 [Cubamyces sp. BRFM 1775]|nr:hypothetical protein GY45DRAFT_930718 [Cubamyces sp. BRFM 1775]
MPRSKTAVACEICGRMISYQHDMHRHMKVHAPNKDELMHRCAYHGCTHASIEKSNVITHYLSAHTDLRPYTCPDTVEGPFGTRLPCPFTTSVPACLTRHRKTLHNYQPKMQPASYTPLASLPIPHDHMVLPPLAEAQRFTGISSSHRSAEASEAAPARALHPEPLSRQTAASSSSGSADQTPYPRLSGEGPTPRYEGRQSYQTVVTSHPYDTRKTQRPNPSALSPNPVLAHTRVEELMRTRTRSSRSGYYASGERTHHRAAPSVQVSLAQFNVLPTRTTAPKC